ncbi:Cytidylate kinase [Buchnera aphidicola (Eriosoma grossulariae)]|uniref:(d)CMP kinase n=1 Tax=Buchnera aphidicola TaxID=9 RepID=UPI003464A36D
MNIVPVITVDGPSAAGKSTLCTKIAKILNWNILESGIIYRILAWIVINNHIPLVENNIIFCANKLKINLLQKYNKTLIFLDGKNISHEIISNNVSNVAAQLAIFPNLRKTLLKTQRCFRRLPGLIANGRDMGTIVFPDACIKFFLYANLKIRVSRRMRELQESGFNVNFNQLLLEMKNRDNIDCKRESSPLIPAKNAIMLNSTKIGIKETLNISLKYIKNYFSS